MLVPDVIHDDLDAAQDDYDAMMSLINGSASEEDIDTAEMEMIAAVSALNAAIEEEYADVATA